MLTDRRITKLVDYSNAKECFPGTSISGGVCYFLWERDREDECEVYNIKDGNRDFMKRPLDEFSVFVRYNKAVSIIHKVRKKGEGTLDEIASPLMPFGISTNVRGKSRRTSGTDLLLHASDGTTFFDAGKLTKGLEWIDKYNVLISKTSSEHAGEPGKDGRFRVITSSARVIGPGEICTHSYFLIGNYDNELLAINTLSYLKTKFVRFLMLQSMGSINISKLVFSFVPLQDFSKPWTDEELYAKYGLTHDEITFIESMIRPMDVGGVDDE